MPSKSETAMVPIPIRPGMREDIHRHAAAEPGTLRYAQNVRWGDLGAAMRRNGTTEIGTTGTGGSQYSAASGLVTELIAPDGTGGTLIGTDGAALALRPAETSWRFAAGYSSAEPRLGRVDLNRDQGSQIVVNSQAALTVDTAGNKFFGYTADAFSDGRAHYTLQDADGNTIEARMYANVRRIRACSAGTDIFVCMQRFASNEIDIYRSAAGGSLTLLTTAFVTLDNLADPWDIAPWTSSRWLFASLDTSSTTITVHRMSAGASVANVTQSTNVRATSRITIHGSPNHAWLGWNDNTVTNGARISCYDAALSAVFTSTTALLWTASTQTGTPPIIGTGPSDTEVRVCLSVYNESGHATPDAYTWKSLIINTSGSITKQTTQFHAIPVSKPFGTRGQYIWADLVVRYVPDDTFESPVVRALLRCRDYTASADFYYVVDLIGHTQAEATTVLGGSFTTAEDPWWTCPVTPEGTYYAALNIDVIGANALSGTSGLSRYFSFREFSVSATTGKRDTTIAGSLTVAGQPCAVIRAASVSDTSFGTTNINTDGFELGIHRAPVIRSLASSNGSGSLTNSGSYQYSAVYRVTDSLGRICRSRPSSPTTIVLGASDDTVTILLATCEMQRSLLTAKGVIELYRTEAGGSTFYLVDDVEPNDTTALQVSISDELADSAITDNRVRYDQVNTVANDMAPACRFLRSSETRVFAAGGWDPTIVQGSQILVPGEVPAWSDLDQFKIRLPKPCVGGLAFQDGALLAFAATDIYAIGTDGGPDNGGVGTFQDPRLISPGIGCEEPNSIVETPSGVFFRSRRGFELLPRGLGAPQSLPGVETTLETYTTVVSSCLHVDETAMSVHVVVRNPSNAATRNLVYDLDRGAWSVDVYPVDIAQVGVTADGRLLLASDDTSTSPAFLVESSSAQDDDSVFYQAKLTFHDIYPVGVYKVCNVNSVFIRGDSQGSCVLNADIGVDGGTAKTATSTFLGATTFEAYRHTTPANSGSHGTSVQISVYDTSSGDAAEGFNVYGLGIVVQDRDQPILTTSAERMA